MEISSDSCYLEKHFCSCSLAWMLRNNRNFLNYRTNYLQAADQTLCTPSCEHSSPHLLASPWVRLSCSCCCECYGVETHQRQHYTNKPWICDMTAQSLVVAFCLQSHPATFWVLEPAEGLGQLQLLSAVKANAACSSHPLCCLFYWFCVFFFLSVSFLNRKLTGPTNCT